MDWAAWAPTMAQVRADFGYDEADDRAAAEELRPHLPTLSWRELGVLVRNRHAVVAGCGPSLLRAPRDLWKNPVVACDGATEFLREQGVVPDVVVTDLDGQPECLAWAARTGSRMVVHAHGDNRDRLREVAPRLGPLLFGTCQVPPWDGMAPLRSVPGFTDGDRAVLLLEALGARSALLVGFDFDQPPSRYSHRWDPATKPRKLAWAGRIVADCVARGKLPVRRYVPAPDTTDRAQRA